MVNRYALLGWLGTAGFCSAALTPAEDSVCRQTVLSACERMERLSDAGNAQGMILRLTSTTTYGSNRSANPKNTVESVTLRKSGRQVFFTDGKTDVAYDDDVFVSVSRPEKMILLLNAPSAAQGAQLAGGALRLRSFLVEQSRILNCAATKNSGKAAQYIKLEPAESLRRGQRMKTIELWVDTKTHFISRWAVDYQPGTDLRRVEVVINQLAPLPTNELKVPPPLTLVFASGRKVLPQYAGYHVVDQRR